MKKIIRVTTVPVSLKGLLKGQLKFMNQFYEVVGVSSPGKALEETSKIEGIRTIPHLMTRTISPFQDLKSTYKLYKLFKKENPFIVHTHTPKAGTVGMLAAKLAGVPNRLHTIAGLPLMEASGLKLKVLSLVEKTTYSCATKIYPNSKGLNEYILKNKFTNQSKLKIIGKGSSNGIDTKHFDPQLFSKETKLEYKKKLNITDTDFVFIFVGRLVKDKGLNELVNVFASINKRHKNCKLLLVGDYESKLDPLNKNVLYEIKNNTNIITTGFIRDVRPCFAIANILVFPSYREGFPNVVLQASSMQLPCIVSDINGCNEIIQQNVNGLLVPAKNQEELKNSMIKLLTTPALVEKLKMNSRSNIIENYEQDYIWNEILKEYKSLEIE